MLRFLTLVLLFSSLTLGATTTPSSLFEELGQEENSALSADLHLEEVILADGERSGVFSFTVGEETHSLSVEVSPRGKFRRHHCTLKPLKLNFNKGELRAAGLLDYDKYKLVVPCHPGKEGERILMREYLAYQAYGLLTPYSFRTQLLELSFQEGDEKRSFPAFLIESKRQFADRMQLDEVTEVYGNMHADFNPAAEVTHALFQYVIANGDWNITLGRNAKLFRKANGELVPVGYDFDFSGWVSAPYARPSSEAGQRKVTDQVYLGFWQPDPVLADITEAFLLKKEALKDLVAKDAYLRYFLRRSMASLEKVSRLGMGMDGYYRALRGEDYEVIPFGANASSFEAME